MVFLVFLCLIAAFAIGSIPSAYLAGKAFGNLDIRRYGSGNVGATNAFRVLGVVPFIAVLVADFLKGLLVVTLFYGLTRFSSFDVDGFLKVGLGIAAIVGHVFSVFLNFRAGKGVATWLGVLLGLSVPLFAIAAGMLVIVAFATGYVSLGSLAGSFGALVAAFPLVGFTPLLLFSFVAFVFISATHHKNIVRLFEGREQRLFKKKTPP